MNRKIILLRLLTVALCLAFVGQALAQTIKVGVSPGDVFNYKVTYFWDSTDPTATPPASFVEANSTEYYRATIDEVKYTTVTLKTVQHFLNGTDINKDELINVGNSLGGCLLVYAADLPAGGYLYPAATDLPLMIDGTVSRPYGSGYRDTNWIEVTMTDVEGYVTRYTKLYFDKSTGVLVDARFDDVSTDLPDQTFSRTIVITESSLWTVAGTPSDGDGHGDDQTGGLSMEATYGIIAAVVIVAVVAVVLVLWKKGKIGKKGKP